MAKKVIDQQLNSNSMFTILPVQDFLATDKKYPKTSPKEERINNPANPHHFWCYRLPKELK
jgi:4-alpha-glucanotransferase